MKVAIIGGSGKMGQWFMKFLLREGVEVILTARNREKLMNLKQSCNVDIAFNNVEAIKNADIILLSVPIDSFEDVVKEISPFVASNQIVVDITSIKESPVKIMHKHIKKGTILGTHPVFGPDIECINGLNFALTPTTNKERAIAAKFEKWLNKREFDVIIISPQEHDKLMSVILGLSHFVGMVTCDTLLALKDFGKVENIKGTSFKMLLAFTKKVVLEDPEFYAALQVNLPDVSKIEQLFCNKAKMWAEIVKNKNKEGFVSKMKNLGEKLGTNSR